MHAQEALEPVTRRAELYPCVDHDIARCSSGMSLSVSIETGADDITSGGGSDPGFVQINASNDFIQIGADDFIQIS